MTPKGCHYRVGTKCQEMTPEEIEKRFIASLNIPEPDICEMESYRQDLTFQILKNYLIYLRLVVSVRKVVMVFQQ